jgi:hypothetical protein
MQHSFPSCYYLGVAFSLVCRYPGKNDSIMKTPKTNVTVFIFIKPKTKSKLHCSSVIRRFMLNPGIIQVVVECFLHNLYKVFSLYTSGIPRVPAFRDKN